MFFGVLRDVRPLIARLGVIDIRETVDERLQSQRVCVLSLRRRRTRLKTGWLWRQLVGLLYAKLYLRDCRKS
jgi:hypothetical protein